MKIEIELSDVEVAALKHAMTDPQEWTENAIRERARLAMQQVVEAETQRMIADPNVTTIPATAEEIVINAIVPDPPEVSQTIPES